MRKLAAATLAGAILLLGAHPAEAKPTRRPRTIIVTENSDLTIPPFDYRHGDRAILIMSQVGGTYGNRERCDHRGGQYVEGVAFGILWSLCDGIDG